MGDMPASGMEIRGRAFRRLAPATTGAGGSEGSLPPQTEWRSARAVVASEF